MDTHRCDICDTLSEPDPDCWCQAGAWLGKDKSKPEGWTEFRRVDGRWVRERDDTEEMG